VALKTIESEKRSPLFLEFNDFQKEAKFQNDTFYVLFVEDNPNQFDILTNWVGDVLAEHNVSKIVWYSARNLETALAYIGEAEKKTGTRGYKGFDLILCDLLIPKTKDRTEENIINGFSAAQKIAERGWLAPIIGLSAYTDEGNVQSQKTLLRQKEFEIEGRPVFADFLAKGKEGFNPNHFALLPAKLRRHIIPLFHYAKQALNFAEPTFFIGDEMLRILRQLVWLSRLESDSWRSLPKILLLGDTGSGKTHLASTYHRFLQLRDKKSNPPVKTRRPSEPITINCASLTAFDLSGQIELFGASDGSQVIGAHRGDGIVTQRGAFERATVHPADNGLVWSGFAPFKVMPAYEEGGVVFFDEFANLHLTLQAGVLNTIEEGWIRRVLDGSVVRIGCHIVCATNADPSETMRDTSKITYSDVGSPRMRKDLIDRIPYVIRVPSLREREPAEILALLERFAMRSSKADEVKITPSAKEILFAAIDKNIVTSIRHLQNIARLQPGEDIISDSNLRWVIEKARILKVKSLLGATGEPTVTEKAKAIGLKKAWLYDAPLPTYTAWAVEKLYSVSKDPEHHQTPNFQEPQFQTTEGQEWRWRYWLLSMYFEDQGTALSLYRSTKGILNSRRSEARKKFGFNGDARHNRKEIETFDRNILLSSKPRVRESDSTDPNL
jgi:CheY-like chemotaxis protein